MKFNAKGVCMVVMSCGIFLSTSAQINLLSNAITFRSSTTYNGETQHWGDLRLEGQNWGWLYCNRIINEGPSYLNGGVTIYNGLNVASGTKNFLQPHPTDSTKLIKYICIEAGEAMTMARGLSKTSLGSVTINLPEHFAFVTSGDAPITILLTPEEAPVLLYSVKKSKEQFTVIMKPADYREFGDAEFAWQVSGIRDGYENEKIIVDADSLINGLADNKPVSEKRAKMNVWAQNLSVKSKAKMTRKY